MSATTAFSLVSNLSAPDLRAPLFEEESRPWWLYDDASEDMPGRASERAPQHGQPTVGQPTSTERPPPLPPRLPPPPRFILPITSSPSPRDSIANSMQATAGSATEAAQTMAAAAFEQPTTGTQKQQQQIVKLLATQTHLLWTTFGDDDDYAVRLEVIASAAVRMTRNALNALMPANNAFMTMDEFDRVCAETWPAALQTAHAAASAAPPATSSSFQDDLQWLMERMSEGAQVDELFSAAGDAAAVDSTTQRSESDSTGGSSLDEAEQVPLRRSKRRKTSPTYLPSSATTDASSFRAFASRPGRAKATTTSSSKCAEKELGDESAAPVPSRAAPRPSRAATSAAAATLLEALRNLLPKQCSAAVRSLCERDAAMLRAFMGLPSDSARIFVARFTTTRSETLALAARHGASAPLTKPDFDEAASVSDVLADAVTPHLPMLKQIAEGEKNSLAFAAFQLAHRYELLRAAVALAQSRLKAPALVAFLAQRGVALSAAYVRSLVASGETYLMEASEEARRRLGGRVSTPASFHRLGVLAWPLPSEFHKHLSKSFYELQNVQLLIHYASLEMIK